MTVPSRTPTSTATTKTVSAPTGTEALKAAVETFATMVERSESRGDSQATPRSEQNSAVSNQPNQDTGATQPGFTAPLPDVASDAPQVADPVAAVIDATLPIAAPIDASAMFTGLVNDLATLKQSLEAGEEISPELLTRINAALNTLSAKLDIDLAALPTPTPTDLASLAKVAGETDMSTPARLAQALAPLAQALLGETPVAANTGPESAPLLKSVGDTLAKLAQALKTESLSADFGRLVSSADDGTDPALGAAIKSLLAAPTPKSAELVAPALATSKLSITETTLVAKTAEAEISSAALGDTASSRDVPPSPEVKARPAADTQTKTRPRAENDNAPVEAKPAPGIAATGNDVREDAPGVTQTTAPSARADTVAPRLVQAGYQTSQQQLNLPQLAFELGRQVGDGNTRFQIRLDPAELGKIEVRLDIDASGQVNARMTVEKSETLDLMQRDQKALERALQQAGLDASKTNLEFSLKQNPFSGGQQQARDDQGLFIDQKSGPTDGVEEILPTVKLYRASLTASGVNIIA